jgi:hypothetical protein
LTANRRRPILLPEEERRLRDASEENHRPALERCLAKGCRLLAHMLIPFLEPSEE